jgi:transcriptional regulator with XRE-family HTH domain
MTLIGAHVKAARIFLGWTLSQLAGRVGLSATTIAHFESGERRLPFFDASVIADTFQKAGIAFDEDGPGVKLRKPE